MKQSQPTRHRSYQNTIICSNIIKVSFTCQSPVLGQSISIWLSKNRLHIDDMIYRLTEKWLPHWQYVIGDTIGTIVLCHCKLFVWLLGSLGDKKNEILEYSPNCYVPAWTTPGPLSNCNAPNYFLWHKRKIAETFGAHRAQPINGSMLLTS